MLPEVEEKSYRYSKHLEQTARARISDGCAGGKRDRCIWSDNELARLRKSMSPRLRTSGLCPGTPVDTLEQKRGRQLPGGLPR